MKSCSVSPVCLFSYRDKNILEVSLHHYDTVVVSLYCICQTSG